uniref:GST C-terminal domain-containing protein n=1 Tax=Heterosigma akashiwo TaxID=2829 RepID=A0A7S3XM83_HETAK
MLVRSPHNSHNPLPRNYTTGRRSACGRKFTTIAQYGMFICLHFFSFAAALRPQIPIAAFRTTATMMSQTAPPSKKAKTALDEMDKKGAFIRTDAGFRDWVSGSSEKFKPEAGRYHLYISWACPWANRCAMVRKLKGLEDAIGLSVVHPTWQRTRPDDAADAHCGWAFAAPGDPPLAPLAPGGRPVPCEGCVPDAVNGAKFVRDLYEKANDSLGKYSVPILWDKKEQTIVNNESSEIIRMLNSEFNAFAEQQPALDLYPPALRAAVDAANAWVYPAVNNGVYRSGFAQTQEAYEEAVDELFAALDRMEALLATNRFLAGPAFTEADVRAFQTLVRFDEVYVVYFKCDKKKISQYPNILNYCREIYQVVRMPSFYTHQIQDN